MVHGSFINYSGFEKTTKQTRVFILLTKSGHSLSSSTPMRWLVLSATMPSGKVHLR